MTGGFFFSTVFQNIPQKTEVRRPWEKKSSKIGFSHSNVKPATGKVKRISTPISDGLCGFHILWLKISLTHPLLSHNTLKLSTSTYQSLTDTHREYLDQLPVLLFGAQHLHYLFIPTVLLCSSRKQTRLDLHYPNFSSLTALMALILPQTEPANHNFPPCISLYLSKAIMQDVPSMLLTCWQVNSLISCTSARKTPVKDDLITEMQMYIFWDDTLRQRMELPPPEA